MKRLFTINLCLLLALACTREMTQPEVTSFASQAGEVTTAVVPAPAQESRCTIPGAAIIYAGEELADQLGEGMTTDSLIQESEEMAYLVKRLGAKSFTRLFPDAGEYEPRTRAEGLHRWFIVEYDPNISISQAKPFLEAFPGIQSVEPNYVIKQAVNINDPYWNQMWGQNNTRYAGYDVNCKPVWDDYTMGNPNVVVAVVDGGFQLNHPDLAANAASSGHYNYVRRNTTITQHFHGTHVAGTIGAVNNNGVGVTGIAGGNSQAGKPGVKLLSLQVFETNSDGSTSSASSFATALKEAADKGAHISQNSWGYNFDFDDNGRIEGSELTYARNAHQNPERSFTQAVDYFNKYAGCDNNGNQLSGSPMKGGLVIFAAGNDDIPYGAPGNYDGCISVGAMSINGSRASFSCYGDWVDICAPGVDVMSTYLSGRYASMSGTSMACPHVSGVAALILSYFGGQGFTADELRARLLGGATEIAASTGSKPIGPLVNAYGSFRMNGNTGIPGQVTSIEAVPVGHNIRVDFEATDGYAYQVMASTHKSDLQDADYQNLPSGVVSATRISSASDTPGTPMSVMLAGLKPSTDYYVAVVAYSFDKKFSPLSEIKQTRTAENQKPVITIEDYPEGGYKFRHHDIVSIPVTVSDPDGDAMTVSFDAKSSRAVLESNNGSSELYNFKLMCPLVAGSGSSNSVVKVSDEVGATSMRTIQFTVLPNTAPEQIKDIPVQLLQKKKDVVSIDLEEYFQDPDDEPLVFRASSMDEEVALAEVSDGILNITAVSQGVCAVKVTASDHAGELVSVDVTVLMREEGTPEVFLSGETVLKSGSITIITGVDESPSIVRIISASGVVVYSWSGLLSAVNPLEIKLDGLAPGIYTLEVTYKGQVNTYTIVKR